MFAPPLPPTSGGGQVQQPGAFPSQNANFPPPGAAPQPQFDAFPKQPTGPPQGYPGPSLAGNSMPNQPSQQYSQQRQFPAVPASSSTPNQQFNPAYPTTNGKPVGVSQAQQPINGFQTPNQAQGGYQQPHPPMPTSSQPNGPMMAAGAPARSPAFPTQPMQSSQNNIPQPQQPFGAPQGPPTTQPHPQQGYPPAMQPPQQQQQQHPGSAPMGRPTPPFPQMGGPVPSSNANSGPSPPAMGPGFGGPGAATNNQQQFSAGPPGMPGFAPSMPSSGPGGMAGGPPTMSGGPPTMPGGGSGMTAAGPPGMPAMPSMPGMAPGMPGMAPGVPGMAPGMPGMAPGMPGMAPGMPGFPQGTGGAPMPGRQGQPQPQQRLDPNMMPSAVEVMEIDSAQAGQFPTGYPHANPPPLVSTDFYAVDQGNCSPRLMRSTMYMAPASNDLLKASQLPFAVACSPFASLHPQERPAPIIDLGPGGPVRCQRCKAYMCPFMEFQDGGRRFRCPFCHATTPVEDVYFAHLDHTGRRTDIDHRPELFLGAYEFIATKQYCKNGLPPKEPAFIFMIDVSYNAIQNGMLNVICANLERVLQRLPKEIGAPESVVHVGLATFDQVVHFFDLSAAQPSMMVVGDVGDMFVPIVDGLLLPYSQAAPAIRAALAEIPRLFCQSRVTETILGPVVQAGLDALQSADRVGKLMVFTTSLPTVEAPGKLKARNERNLLGTDKEKTALMPQGEFYTKLGEQCVKNGVTVDLFLFPNSFVDVASIAQLSAVTGGNVYKYQYFVAEKDSSRFLADLSHNVSRNIAFDCMARVRSSAGIRPVLFQGSFYMENSTDLEIASLDEDKTFFAEMKHDDKLTDQNAIIQCAVLFTSVSGQRRLRILNLCLPVSSDYNQLYRVADQGALVSYLLKNAVQINREKGLKDMKEQIFQRCAQILATYREKVSESAPLGQLILPETLKLLPLFVNSIVKNDSINGGSEMTVDDKVWMIELIRGMRVDHSMLLLYPKIAPVDHLELQDPQEITSITGTVRASYDNLSNTKAYLIDNGIVLFLWIGLGVAEAWIQDIFGVNSVAMLDTENAQIPEKDNARSRGLRRAVELLQETGPRKRKLFVVREKDALEPWMKKFLVEDRSGPNVMSYVDFLCYIHREIRNILA
ncbi:hypothetical protein Q1695_006296 [Nippostrongylus brasiliensis]|nr:hypothetical protein Q1695_006296 [Nippostrongylus brasiliensis]